MTPSNFLSVHPNAILVLKIYWDAEFGTYYYFIDFNGILYRIQDNYTTISGANDEYVIDLEDTNNEYKPSFPLDVKKCIEYRRNMEILF